MSAWLPWSEAAVLIPLPPLAVIGSHQSPEAERTRYELVMALHSPIPRPLSLDEAVDAVFRAALDGGSVADAAREFAHQIDDRDIYEVVADGLAARAHRLLARQRNQSAEDGADDHGESEPDSGSAPQSPPKARAHAARQFWALQGNYEGADGTRKSLLKFTLEDATSLRSIAGGRAEGWIRVRDAMDRAISALQQHSAKTIGSLPEVEKRAINARLA
jgi:hypothetical protein